MKTTQDNHQPQAPRVSPEILDSQPPADSVMERQLLGSIMLDAAKLQDVSGLVSRDIFYEERHRLLFEHLENMPAEVAHDVSLITRWLLQAADLEACGGVDYLMEIAQSVPYAANAVYYAEIVRDLAVKRRIREQAEGLLQLSMNPTMSADDLRMEVAAMAQGMDSPTDSLLLPFSAADLDNAIHEVHFLIQNVLPQHTPTIVGGSMKSCKTLIAIDAAVSIASGQPFLGWTETGEPANVIYFSGEGGRIALQDYARRIAISKGLTLADVQGLWFCDQLPQFNDPTHLSILRKLIRQKNAKVVFLDPCYLGLVTDREGSIFSQGPTLRRLNETIIGEGCTPVLLHHTKRSVADPTQPGELADLSWAGFGEFAGTWWLLSRREKYNPETPGTHRLWLSIGSRLGCGGLFALNATEGSRADPGGRHWSVEVQKPDEVRQGESDRKEQARQERANLQLEQDRRAVVDCMAKIKRPETMRAVRDMAGVGNGQRFNRAWGSLLSDGTVVLDGEITKGNRQVYEAFKLREGD
jgi:replicative DNA helicase